MESERRKFEILTKRSVARYDRGVVGLIAVAWICVFATSHLQAQVSAGSELTISLITVAPGSKSWEMFGHNAIRVRDAARGTDVSYNYGLFSFQQENFLLRFIQGRMLYWMAGLGTDTMLETYRGANRSIWEQELNLTPEQRIEFRYRVSLLRGSETPSLDNPPVPELQFETGLAVFWGLQPGDFLGGFNAAAKFIDNAHKILT